MIIKKKILKIIVTNVFFILFTISKVDAAEIYNTINSKLDFFGKVSGVYYISNSSVNCGDKTDVNIGFKSETQINDYLIGYSQWQYSLLENSYFETSSFSKKGHKFPLMLIGIKVNDSDYGSLNYGHNYSVIYDALAYTNSISEHGGINNDNFFMNLIRSIITYHNENFFGFIDRLNFSFQYLNKNRCTSKYVITTDKFSNMNNLPYANGNGWAVSLGYGLNDFYVVGAYGRVSRINLQKDSVFYQKRSKNKSEQWVIGLKYDVNNIYLAANYGNTYNIIPIKQSFVNKTQDILLVFQYKLRFGLRPSIAYIQSTAKDTTNIGGRADLTKYIEVSMNHLLNKNMSTHISYKINQININNKLGIDSSNAVSFGIVYRF